MLTVSSTILQVNHLQQLSGNKKNYNKKALKSMFQSIFVLSVNNLQTIVTVDFYLTIFRL
ncbi:hypothetical protein C5O71_03730 [Streptococcus pseudopneumoniae]|nr:hypothetical protein C5O71_03730 [Streptococcus pseudopneumoniae]TMR78906.1 hypothetical protein E3V35_09180 [Streptococcus pseudopneumoniae]